MRSGEKPSRVNWWPSRGHAVYPVVFAIKYSSVAQLEWPNQFVLMYHGVICLYNWANYERFAFATSSGPPGESRARVPPRSLPFPSPARLLSNDPVDAAALFTLTRITITRSSTYTFSLMSRRNVDNDGATVIRRMDDCCRTVRPNPGRSISIRRSSGESALDPANERHREHDWLFLYMRTQVMARSSTA